MNINQIITGDCLPLLQALPANSVDLVLTSPPYFQQREYGGNGLGNEATVNAFVQNLLPVFRECIRVIKPTGLVVFNLGDKYIDGNLLLVPYRFAIEAQCIDSVRLVNELTWVKANPTPKQDPKKLISATEPFFIFAKSGTYHFDKDAFLEYKDRLLSNGRKTVTPDLGKKYFELIDSSALSPGEKAQARRELSGIIQEVKAGTIESFRMKIRGIHALPYGGQAGGRLTQIETKGFTLIKIHGNSIRRDVIESTVETIKGNQHPAVYPEFVVQEIIKLLSKPADLVLDPFIGSGTTAVVARRLGRQYLGFEIYPVYADYARERLATMSAEQTLEIIF
jgi:DNA modification methylase